VEGHVAPVRKREGHVRVNFGGGCATTMLTEKGAAAGRSCSHFSEGRCFDNRRWTRGEYTWRE
jgi:hypothetical protein